MYYYKMLRVTVFAVLSVGVAVLVGGCFTGSTKVSPISPASTGDMIISAVLAKGLQENLPIGRASATLTRNSQVVCRDLVIDKHHMTASGKIPKVMIGVWDLRVDVYSPKDELLFSGSTTVSVKKNETATVEIVLTTAPGDLHVVLDLTEFAGYELVKGKLILAAGAEPTIVKDFPQGENHTVSVSIKDLPPHTHDLKVEIYKDTYHAYNCIYRGPWQVINVSSGETTNLSWSPSLGLVDVIGKIDLPPPSPTVVEASVAGGNVVLNWDGVEPPENDLWGYRVYVQWDEFL
ncbi:MAG: hypothetical protein GX316_10770, partial [Firmicutes bacterium]|nr:hypothetical protein [Bacillota bacterium]